MRKRGLATARDLYTELKTFEDVRKLAGRRLRIKNVHFSYARYIVVAPQVCSMKES